MSVCFVTVKKNMKKYASMRVHRHISIQTWACTLTYVGERESVCVCVCVCVCACVRLCECVHVCV